MPEVHSLLHLLDTNLFIVLHHIPGTVYNDFYTVSDYHLDINREEYSQIFGLRLAGGQSGPETRNP
jgi:hypothetical protein